MVSKTIAYEQAGPAAGAALLVTDGAQFAGPGDMLAALLPAAWKVGRLDTAAAGEAGTDLLRAALAGGLTVLNYLGHGSAGTWSHGALTADQAATLTNARLPIGLLMTCLNGYFHDPAPGAGALAEALLNAQAGGAAAAWASSSLTRPEPQAALNAELLRRLFGGAGQPSLTLGEAAAAAKAAVPDPDARRSWILFGDPALRVR
jgi:hypothetical protein